MTDPVASDEPVRLCKLMAQRGLCSRREADDWIAKGWVRVNRVVIQDLGVRVSPQSHIEIDRAAQQDQSRHVTILLHKPLGYVSGQPEKGYSPAVALITPKNRWREDTSPLSFHPAQLRGLAPAGRLDIDSTGLLVLTQDGRIASQLIHEHSAVEKEYWVKVEGNLTPEGLQLLNHGLMLDDVQLKPARVSWRNPNQLRFILKEGRKRQIRRMCALVGLKIIALKRVRIGKIVLGDLPPGRWRYLGKTEHF